MEIYMFFIEIAISKIYNYDNSSEEVGVMLPCFENGFTITSQEYIRI